MYVIISAPDRKNVLLGRAKLSARRPLRLNVGFLLHANVGFSRNFAFDLGPFQLDDFTFRALRGSITFTRTSQGLLGQGRMHVTTPQECARCLSEFDQPLTIELADLFAYPPSEASDPLLAIPETAIVDLGPLVRELALLEVPIRPLCRPDCNGLCPVCGKKQDSSRCKHSQTDIDPRLAPLQSLLDQH